LVDEHKQEISICSPGILQILDDSGRITGQVGGFVRYEVPNIVYDEDSLKAADIIFPQGQYRIRVVGNGTGPYSLYILQKEGSSQQEFKALSIPIAINEIHEYIVDWSKLDTSSGVLIKIDANGDGVFERSVNSDGTLTGDEFMVKSDKVMVCHLPPGNPANAHTINIDSSAVKAHLAHGDYVGECKATTTQNKFDEKIPPGQLKKSK